MATPRIAFKTSMQVDGLEELRETLKDIAPREANNILRNTVHGLAGRVRDEMKTRVPVDSGDLKKSIMAIRRRGKPNFPISEVRVGAKAPYGLMVEWGTSRTPAQPYIVPTVESLRPSIPQIYRDEFAAKFEAAMLRKAKRASKK
jgi:HK97 gp10 family phage protein